MSIRSWKAEFIQSTGSSDLEMLKEAYNKWIGLRLENLRKHRCHLSKHIVTSYGKEFVLNASSCNLCVEYMHTDEDQRCSNCPLHKSLGHSCDNSLENAPWVVFINTKDPEPMILEIRKAIDVAKKLEK